MPGKRAATRSPQLRWSGGVGRSMQVEGGAHTRPSTPLHEDQQELEDFAPMSSPPLRSQSTSPFPAPQPQQPIRPFRDYEDEEEGGEHEILGQQQTMMNGEWGRGGGGGKVKGGVRKELSGEYEHLSTSDEWGRRRGETEDRRPSICCMD